MPPERRLVAYPYVKVRIACELCKRTGEYRLARLAAHYGAEIALDDLLAAARVEAPDIGCSRCPLP